MKHTLSIGVLVLLLFTFKGYAQEQKPLNLQDLLLLVAENNLLLKSEELRVEQTKSLQKTAFDLGKTQLYFNKDENNLSVENTPLRVWGVQQTLEFPSVYIQRKKLKKYEMQLAEGTLLNVKIRLECEVSKKFYQYQTIAQKIQIYQQIDSIYRHFSTSANRKFELGETNYLEKITAHTKHKHIQLQLQQVQTEKQKLLNEIHTLVQAKEHFEIALQKPEQLQLDIPDIQNLKGVNLFEQREKVLQVALGLERQKLLPELSFDAFTGVGSGTSKRYNGFQLGVQIPIFFWGHSGHIKGTKIQQEIAQNQTKNNAIILENRLNTLKQTLQQERNSLHYYQTEGNHLSEEILKMAQQSFKQGEIDYFQYIQSLENGYQLKIEYLQSLDNYNQTLLQLHYLMYEEP